MCAVPSKTVICSFFNSCFPGVLLMYFMNDFDVVPVAPVISGIIFLHSSYIYIYIYI